MSGAVRKHLLALARDPAYRSQANKILISGHHICTEHKGPVHQTFLTEAYLQRKGPPPTSFTVVGEELLRRVTSEGRPEGIIQVIPRPSISTYLGNYPRRLLLYNLTDPRNVGALFRTALALGWDQVILYGQAPDPFHPEAIRASKGAVLRLTSLHQTSDELTLIDLLKQPIAVLLADATAVSTAAFKDTASSQRLLVLGSESHGLANLPACLRARGIPTSIPTSDSMPFLGVAAAGAILMHQLR